MSGYAATARITDVHPRFVAGGGAAAARDGRVGERSRDDRDEILPLELAAVDGDETATDSTMAERLDAIRERWSQLTFYLFSAESWR